MSSFGKILRREVRKSYWQLIPGQQKLHAALTYLAGMGPTSKVFSGRPALSKMRTAGRVCPAVNLDAVQTTEIDTGQETGSFRQK